MTDTTPPPTDDDAGREAARSRRRRWRVIALCVLLPTLFTLSTLLYLDERDARQARHQFGVRTAADWVELDVTAQKIDTVAHELLLSVVPRPHGALAQAPNSFTFTWILPRKPRASALGGIGSLPSGAECRSVALQGLT